MALLRSPLLAGVLALAACGGGDSAPEGAGPETTATTAAPSTTATTAPAPATSAPTTAAPATSGPTSTAPPGGVLPGEPFDSGPEQGAVLGVVGVAHDDVLNVRARPGADQDIVTTLSPTFDAVVAAGNARLVDGGVWYEVEVEGDTGWVSSRFVAHLGATTDVTAAVVAALGERPSAESMLTLGEIVAGARSSDEPPSRITRTTVPEVDDDTGRVVYDVVGLGDDSVLGERLAVIAATDPSGDGFTVMAVEATALCARGSDGEGLCL